MRKPPPLSEIPRFPVTGGVALLAAGVTIAHFAAKVPVAPLVVNERVLLGEVWRFVTSILPHGNAIHLIFNLMWLWTLGSLIETELGQVRTFLLYVFLAFGSSAAEFALGGSGIGLSGVVYGLWGLCFVLHRRDPRFADATDKGTNQLLAFWFVLCIVLTYAGVWRIANVAHGAGAVLGMLVGLGMSVRPRAAWWGTAVMLTAASVFAATRLRPWVNFSRDADPEFTLGDDAAKKGRDAEAERWYRLGVRIDPRNAAAWFNLGLFHARANRLPEAADSFRRARKLDPGEPKYQQADDEYAQYLSTDASGPPRP